MRTLLSLLIIWGVTAFAPALAKVKSDKEIAKLPPEETCGAKYARWQYLYVSGEISDNAQKRDWAAAIEKANVFRGVLLTCWERFNLSMLMAEIHAANDELNLANAYLNVADELSGLAEHQIKRRDSLRVHLNSESWKYATMAERRAEAKYLANIDAPNRGALELKKPKTSGIINKMKSYGAGEVMCFVLLDIDVEGKPTDMVSRCNLDDFENVVLKGVRRVRYSPQYEDGKPVKKYGVIYPFILRIK